MASKPPVSPVCRSMRPTFSTSFSNASSSFRRSSSGLSSISRAVLSRERVAAVSSWRRIRLALATRSASRHAEHAIRIAVRARRVSARPDTWPVERRCLAHGGFGRKYSRLRQKTDACVILEDAADSAVYYSCHNYLGGTRSRSLKLARSSSTT